MLISSPIEFMVISVLSGKAGENISFENKNDITPLMFSCAVNMNISIVMEFIDLDADVNSVTEANCWVVAFSKENGNKKTATEVIKARGKARQK